MNGEQIDKVVQVRTVPGASMGCAHVVSYCDAPTFQLVGLDGKRFSWRTDLCAPASEEDAAGYWRQRAEAAEERLRQLESEDEY